MKHWDYSGLPSVGRYNDAVDRVNAAEQENERLWAVLNGLIAKADPCACTHDDENCCAKVGEECIVCAIELALAATKVVA